MFRSKLLSPDQVAYIKETSFEIKDYVNNKMKGII